MFSCCRITSLLFLLVCSVIAVTLVDVNASSFNITTGSSISTWPNHTSYWLSPSSDFAFGFYPLSSDDGQQYTIGIWLNRNHTRSLVWAVNCTDHSVYGTNSSIYFNQQGLFMVQVQQGEEAKLLFNVEKLASYALMQDNGNLVLYSFDSNVIWQSFDYPTNTILAGQRLKPGQSLMSSSCKKDYYQLILQQDGDLVTYKVNGSRYTRFRSSKTAGESMNISNLVLNLNSDGHLYLGDHDKSFITKNFTQGEKHLDNGRVYRATLDTDGILRLYKESEKSFVVSHNTIPDTCPPSATCATMPDAVVKPDSNKWTRYLWPAAAIILLCILLAWAAYKCKKYGNESEPAEDSQPVPQDK
ncbi:hypothetical protein IFM89_001668 [Coptis chinensis]|uniref:Bulb-type lectin domain-containing protein n=1 Tax=Coptis chinensis TaxID=261450 RepID=A0A835LP64_9MAGN|nr:hypothetical protein IFM89_001668 [Coptis chinensis]